MQRYAVFSGDTLFKTNALDEMALAFARPKKQAASGETEARKKKKKGPQP